MFDYLDGPSCRQLVGMASNLNFTRELIGTTDSFEICVMARGNRHANGFTWFKDTGECYAIYDAKFINERETCCESCIFKSKSCIFVPYKSNIRLIILMNCKNV